MKKLSALLIALMIFSVPAFATYTEQGIDVNPDSLVFEGATDNAFETTFAVTDTTTPDKTITFPDKTGTVVLSTDIDTIAEIEAYLTTTNILLETEIDASSELLALMDDETGTGALVFANTPTLVTPVLGAATGTSIVLSSTFTSSATGALGWTKVDAANQACNTTCTSACVIGMDAGASAFLDCATATADSCICAGSS